MTEELMLAGMRRLHDEMTYLGEDNTKLVVWGAVSKTGEPLWITADGRPHGFGFGVLMNRMFVLDHGRIDPLMVQPFDINSQLVVGTSAAAEVSMPDSLPLNSSAASGEK